jgi:hypothetical protein
VAERAAGLGLQVLEQLWDYYGGREVAEERVVRSGKHDHNSPQNSEYERTVSTICRRIFLRSLLSDFGLQTLQRKLSETFHQLDLRNFWKLISSLILWICSKGYLRV